MISGALISVIVPVYRVETYLDRCVQSIVSQTYQNLEIILVDDGSPDRCPAMCDAWAEKDSRICVIHKENGGLSDARNAGMAAATGEYISFVDSDDWIAPEMLERLVKALERDGSDVAACSVDMVWEDGRPNEALTVRKNLVLERDQAQLALLRENLLKQPVWYKLYRRETIRNILFERGKYHEDVFWSYQAIGNARCVSLIDYVGYFYFQRSGSIMGEGYSLKRLDAIEAMQQRYEYLAIHAPDLESEARLSIWASCMYHGQMALRYLPKHEQDICFRRLYAAVKNHPIRHCDYARRKATHRVWLDLARISFLGACRLRNLFKIGQ